MLNIDRFEQYLREGRLIRDTWVGIDEQGRVTACWLSALFDEVAEKRSVSACPASELPLWFARLIPWMDDYCSEAHWVDFAKRLAIVLRAPRSPDQWHRAEYASRALIVREAMRHTRHPQTLDACDRVASLCEEVAGGAPRNNAMFDHAARAAWAASQDAAARAAARAARAAALASESVTDAAAEAAWSAASLAAKTSEVEAKAAWSVASWTLASESVEAEAARPAASWTVEAAQDATAADRIVDGVLRVLEGQESL